MVVSVSISICFAFGSSFSNDFHRAVRARSDRGGRATNQEFTEPVSQTRCAEKNAVGSPVFGDLYEHFLRVTVENISHGAQTGSPQFPGRGVNNPLALLVFCLID
jgi:hypothetical protein